MNKKRGFPDNFMYKNEKAFCLDSDQFPTVSQEITEVMNALQVLHRNRLVVMPHQRERFLAPFVRMCYDFDSCYNQQRPKWFAHLIALMADFRKRETGTEVMDAAALDRELQRLKRKLLEDR